MSTAPHGDIDSNTLRKKDVADVARQAQQAAAITMCQPTKIIEYHKTHREPVLDAETIALGYEIAKDPDKALALLVSTGMYDEKGRQVMVDEMSV